MKLSQIIKGMNKKEDATVGCLILVAGVLVAFCCVFFIGSLVSSIIDLNPTAREEKRKVRMEEMAIASIKAEERKAEAEIEKAKAQIASANAEIKKLEKQKADKAEAEIKAQKKEAEDKAKNAQKEEKKALKDKEKKEAKKAQEDKEEESFEERLKGIKTAAEAEKLAEEINKEIKKSKNSDDLQPRYNCVIGKRNELRQEEKIAAEEIKALEFLVFEKMIKEGMHDPDSFELVSQNVRLLNSGNKKFTIKFRAKNAFGAKVINTFEAVYNPKTDEIISSEVK